MKLLFYIDSLGAGGAQRVMSNLINHYISLNNEVVFVTDYQSMSESYEVDKKVRRNFLRDDISGKPIQKNIERTRRLRRLLIGENPDIAVSFLGHPNTRLLLAAIGLRTKVLVSVRNDPNREYGKSKAKRFIFNLLFQRADGVVFQTKDAASYFGKSINKKARVIMNPVSQIFFETEHSVDSKDIITLGRLNVQKNQKLLIEAYYTICSQINDNLLIYGEGDQQDNLDALIKRLGLHNRVILKGNTAEANKVLSDAKLFVLSSNYEGMPNALMEAMAVGVPCVSTDCPCGGPKVLLNDGAGILVPVENKNALAQAMLELCKDKTAQQKYSLLAKKNAEKFKPTYILKEWDTYIEQILR